MTSHVLQIKIKRQKAIFLEKKQNKLPDIKEIEIKKIESERHQQM